MTISMSTADHAIVNQTTCKGTVTKMRRKITINFIVLLSLVLTMAGVNDARAGECGTIVPPGSVVGAHWTLAGSPYCVTGDIALIGVVIDAGVEVWVDGDYQIEFVGNVTAVGTEDQPILFTEKDEDDNWNGIFMDNAFPPINLEYCIIEKSDTSGLRIYNTDTPTIEYCIIRNNSRAGQGGGVYIDNSTSGHDIELSGCTIEANTSTSHGGGVRAIMGDGELRFVDSTISDNYANPGASNGSYVGGAGYITGHSRFTGCIIKGNTVRSHRSGYSGSATGRGGGFYFDGDTEMENCNINTNQNVVSGNSYVTRRAYGGGLYNYAGSLSLTNCVVACNALTAGSGEYGGGLYVNVGSSVIVNSSLARNDREGIYVGGGTVEVTNSIVYFNYDGGVQIHPAGLSVTYSNVQGGYDGKGNINYSPGFYGDDCECPDFRITPYSPCVDAGNPLEKFNDGCQPPGYGKARNDMGAYGGPLSCEWSCLEPADLNCDGIVSTMDLLELFANWGACPDMPAECKPDLDCNGTVGTNDLLILFSRWG